MKIRMCAIRGRYGGEQTHQTLEVGEADFSHTLTSVQKDNYVIELTDSPDWEDMEKRK